MQKIITLEVNKVEFVSDRMLYTLLRGCWCDIIVLNDEIDAMKGRFMRN
jgi:hypothetical protein